MARNPVQFPSPDILSKKKNQLQSSLPLIVAVFKRISVEYTTQSSTLSATQFTVQKSDFQ